MKVIVYLRISKDREGRKLGVERQREDCLELCRRHGWTVVDVIEENDRSASRFSKKKRPKFDDMMVRAERREFDAIVSWSFSRLTRRALELEARIFPAFDNHGVRFPCVDGEHDLGTPQGRRRIREDAARNEEESDEISKRVKRESVQKAEQGRYYGGPRAFGFGVVVGQDPKSGKDVWDLAPINPTEAPVVKEWYERIAAGGSILGIRMDMHRRNIMSTAGKPWHDSSIKVVLRNPRNMGKRILHGVEYQAGNPPIVDERVWRTVQRILDDPARKTNFNGSARKYVGAGLYVCDQCSRKVRTTYGSDGRGRSFRKYACSSRDGGCGRSWQAEKIDDWVSVLVGDVLATRAADLLPVEEDQDHAAALDQELRDLDQELTVLGEERGQRKGQGLKAFLAAVKSIEQRMEEIQLELSRTGATDPVGPLVRHHDPRQAWTDLTDVAQRQATIGRLMTVRLLRPQTGRVRWSAEKVIRVVPN